MSARSTLVILSIIVVLGLLVGFLPATYLALGLLALPMFGAVVGALLPKSMCGREWGMGISGATLVAAVAMAFRFQDWFHSTAYQFPIFGPRSEALGTQLSLGVDQISLLLVLLTAILHPLAILISFRSIHTRTREYYAWMSFLLVTMLGCFLASDLLTFYVFFELSLIPQFFVIGIWGGKDRRRAAGKLFLYNFVGSIFALPGIIYLGMTAHTYYLPELITFVQTHLGTTERFWILLSLLAAFLVKAPIFPFHTWLPIAHAEAPAGGSVDISSMVLKLGTYGLIRIALPIGLVAAGGGVTFYPILIALAALSIISILYAGLIAWVQHDLKRVIAYSSVSHLGLCVLGMLALNAEGMAGSMLYMINNGLISGALFIIVGMIYNRYHTRDMRELSGLARAMPKLAFFLLFFTMATIGLPGLNGFVSEFLSLFGTFKSANLGIPYGILAVLGILLSAMYMLRLASKILFGPLAYPILTDEHTTHETDHKQFVMGGDIGGRETSILAVLALGVLFIGIYPAPILRALEGPLSIIRSGAPAATASLYPSSPTLTVADAK